MAFINLDGLKDKARGMAELATEKVRDVAEVAGDKARDVADSAKLAVALAQEQRELERNYQAIGQWFCQEYKGEIPEALRDVLSAVEANRRRIEKLKAAKENGGCVEAVDLAESGAEAEAEEPEVECPVCHEMSRGKFCAKCGAPLQ